MSSLGAKLQKQMLFEFDDDVSGGDEGVDLSAKLDRLLAELEIPNPWVASCKHGLLHLWGCQGIGTWCLPCTQWVHDDMHETLQSHVSNLEAWLTPEDYYIGALSAWGLRCLQKRSPVSKTGWNKVTCKQKTKEMLAMSLPVLKAHIQECQIPAMTKLTMTRTTTTKLMMTMMMTSVWLTIPMSLAHTLMAICVPMLVAAFLRIAELPRRSNSVAASARAPMAHMEDSARCIGLRLLRHHVHVDLTNQLRQLSHHRDTWYHNKILDMSSTPTGGGMGPSRHQARPVG